MKNSKNQIIKDIEEMSRLAVNNGATLTYTPFQVITLLQRVEEKGKMSYDDFYNLVGNIAEGVQVLYNNEDNVEVSDDLTDVNFSINYNNEIVIEEAYLDYYTELLDTNDIINQLPSHTKEFWETEEEEEQEDKVELIENENE